MATETATIRVARTTRDRFAEQAHERGVSLAALLAEIARERQREAMFESERRARLSEIGDPTAEEEMRMWEATLEDGID
jgi:stringent starvation protein B